MRNGGGPKIVVAILLTGSTALSIDPDVIEFPAVWRKAENNVSVRPRWK